MPDLREKLRRLPKIDVLVTQAGPSGLPGWALTRAAREVVDGARQAILDGRTTSVKPACEGVDFVAAVVARARGLVRPSLVPVINATGVILHTGLGRAPLAREALDAAGLAAGYSNLELDLETGKRGSRHGHVAGVLRDVSGAEDAVVVNNNAAAVLLVLAAAASGGEVVVSRGELIEIGGSFRIPEVMAISRARLREVGTTNKTRMSDYEQAIGDDTRLLLKVHRANFEMVGFTEEVGAAELAELGRGRGVATMMDLGSGALLDPDELEALGLGGEPTVRGTLDAGIDVVTFSGDKLLGGPQAGVIAGKRELVAAARQHPLMRALRPDKLTLTTLSATLELYRRREEGRIPAVALLRRPVGEVRASAEDLVRRAGEVGGLRVEAVACESTVGGGAKPTAALPSWGVRLTGGSADQLAAALRAAEPAILARVEQGAVILDLRCVGADDLEFVVRALRELPDSRHG